MAKVEIIRTITQTFVVEDHSQSYFDDEKKRNMTIPEVVEYELSLDVSDYADVMFDKDPSNEQVIVTVEDENGTPIHQAKREIYRDDDGTAHVRTDGHQIVPGKVRH